MLHNEDIKRLHARYQKLKQDRTEWDQTWRDIQDFLLPRKGRFLSRGDRPDQDAGKTSPKIVDATATRALRTLSAGMQGGLTSPARPWFKLDLYDQDLVENERVKQWLHTVQQRLYTAFSQSNFYTVSHNLYTELGAFGTASVYEAASNNSYIHFRPQTVGEYFLAANQEGVVDTYFRWFWKTVRQVAQMFGKDKLSLRTQSLLDRSPDEHIQVVHMVFPRDDFDPRNLDASGMPWGSVYFEGETEEQDRILSVGGYQEFPYLCPRWDTTGAEVYGWSPAMDSLPDIKTLQEMAKDRLKATKKAIDPPLMAPANLKRKVKTLPGGVNYVDTSQQDGFRPLYQFQPDLQASTYSIEDMRNAIREGFFNDLFLMTAQSLQGRSDVTATEVAERHEEKLIMLGPVIERQHSEFLSPLIDRSFGILERAGLLPPPPRELEGMDIKVEYNSLLSQAQKMVGTQSLEKLLGFVGSMAEAKPEALDKLDADEIIDEYADMVGVPPKTIRSAEVVAKVREARQQALMRQQQMEQLKEGASTAKELSQASTEDSNLLKALMEGVR